jgi:SnoaL-like protein
MTTASTVLEANLERVFNERDPTLRRRAIEELYAADAVLYEQEGKYAGRKAIEGAITHLLGSLPPTLVFVLVAPVMQNHEMGKLLWRGQLPDGTLIVTGTDVAQVEGGRIRSVHVFVDPPK